MLLIDVQEAQITLPQLLEAASRGEEIVITRADQPVAKLVQASEYEGRLRHGSAQGLVQTAQLEGDLRYGSAKGLVFIGPDFDAPLEEFSEYQ